MLQFSLRQKSRYPISHVSQNVERPSSEKLKKSFAIYRIEDFPRKSTNYPREFPRQRSLDCNQGASTTFPWLPSQNTGWDRWFPWNSGLKSEVRTYVCLTNLQHLRAFQASLNNFLISCFFLEVSREVTMAFPFQRFSHLENGHKGKSTV